ncbi:MAG: hypothetical protein JJT75_07960 [Opitutales bacterium]|nr:hypothetical protein [Opitutales bacterium]
MAVFVVGELQPPIGLMWTGWLWFVTLVNQAVLAVSCRAMNQPDYGERLR